MSGIGMKVHHVYNIEIRIEVRINLDVFVHSHGPKNAMVPMAKTNVLIDNITVKGLRYGHVLCNKKAKDKNVYGLSNISMNGYADMFIKENVCIRLIWLYSICKVDNYYAVVVLEVKVNLL